MNSAEQDFLLDFVGRFSQGLAAALGNNCEVVVHDLRRPESSIIAIANGHITGRSVGDTLDALGFELLKQQPASDLLNYRTKTKDGKVLRSSSVFLRDDSGQVFGALCINADVSGLVQVQQWLQESIGPSSSTVDESFEHTVDEVLEKLLQSAISAIGKDPADLTREDKVAIVSYLDSKGAFLVRYSVDRVAELLKLTKYTIYNYLDEIKQSGNRHTGKAGTLAADVIMSLAGRRNPPPPDPPATLGHHPRAVKKRRKAAPVKG